MTIDAAFEGLDLRGIPDGFRVGSAIAPVGGDGEQPLLGFHGGIGNLVDSTWTGQGFNLIWRPHFPQSQSDHFLQLNMTSETTAFSGVGGPVPNRGLIEKDIAIYAVRYLQQIHDANFPVPVGGGGLHVEPGFWLSVPVNAEAAGLPTLVRCASIPHGVTIVAQGSATSQLPINIPAANTVPFNSSGPVPIPNESTITNASSFRTSPLPASITQDIVDNPNELLTNALASLEAQGSQMTDVVIISVASVDPATQSQAEVGSIGIIPFLGPNASITSVDATLWIEKITNAVGHSFLQLQYSQTVILTFNGISWPHVTVGTLVKST